MSRPKLGKPQKQLVAIIETEGGNILTTRNKGIHIETDFTFDGHHVFTQYLPHGKISGGRWEKNFRAAVRKQKASK